MKGKEIVLHSTGESVINYSYSADAVMAILTILLNGKTSEAYNVSDVKNGLSVGDIAQMLAKKYSETGTNVRYDIPENAKTYGYNKTTKYLLDNQKIQGLGCKFRINIETAFERFVRANRHIESTSAEEKEIKYKENNK